MTKPVSRKMAVDNLLWLIQQPGGTLQLADGRLAFRCYICGVAIMPGQVIQFDHVHAIVHEGPHHHEALRPVHYDPCHKKKSGRDVKDKAKGDRLLGLTKNKPKPKMRSKPFQKTRRPMQKRIKP